MRGVIRKSLGVCAGLVLLAPASAFASVASIDTGGIARLQASANEVNDVTVGERPGLFPGTKTVVFTDDEAIQVQGNCVHPDPDSSRIVNCVVPETSALVRVALEDESDRLAASSLDTPTTLRISSEGDGGNDALNGTVNRDVLDGVSGLDTIHGFGGNDGLQGGSGDDDLFGEAGDDTLDGDSGNDDLRGGPGRDVLRGGSGSDNVNASDNGPGDTVDCGESLFNDNDLVLADPGDLFTNCERVIIAP